MPIPSANALSPGLWGFWGPVTSTVDWCEVNYEHSRYVCEFFNTVSSVAMLLTGALGLRFHRRCLEPRFRLAFLLLCLVGIGSIAFHATLRFEFQMLDELPMLYVALVLVYILCEDGPAPRYGRRFPHRPCGGSGSSLPPSKRSPRERRSSTPSKSASPWSSSRRSICCGACTGVRPTSQCGIFSNGASSFMG